MVLGQFCCLERANPLLLLLDRRIKVVTLLRLMDVAELGDFGALGCTKVLSLKHLNLNRSKNPDIA